MHDDMVCTHCVAIRKAVGRGLPVDGPLFPEGRVATPFYQSYRDACTIMGGTLRSLPLSDHPLLHHTWTSLLPPLPPDQERPAHGGVPARSWTTTEDADDLEDLMEWPSTG